jgi:hypothetical protein
MRRAARVDLNQSAIVDALERCGAVVQSLAALGKGVPDLLVSFRGRLLLVEIKNGDRSPSKRRLTAAQASWHARWPVVVVESVAGALAALEGRP